MRRTPALVEPDREMDNAMTDDNDVIEEAAKSIIDAKLPGIGWGTLSESAREPYRKHARAAFAVFEKAHAPTDDERDKAIRWAVIEECQGHHGGEPHATTWARGGYRNDVPTLCDRCARLIETLKALPALRRSEVEESQDELVCTEPGHAHCDRQYTIMEPQGDDEEIDPEECKACGEVGDEYRCEDPQVCAEDDGHGDFCKACGKRREAPQGEPSDAQVEAAADAWVSFHGHHEHILVMMRAALRAAGVVGQEGESRG